MKSGCFSVEWPKGSVRSSAERRRQVIERDLVRGGGPGTALALTSITAQIQAAFTTHYGKTKKNGGGFAATNGSQSTLDAGVSAGRNLNLNSGHPRQRKEGTEVSKAKFDPGRILMTPGAVEASGAPE